MCERPVSSIASTTPARPGAGGASLADAARDAKGSAVHRPDRDVRGIPRYGRNVTTNAVLAGRIPVTRVTPALPDGRWRPKAYAGEVVPFRATVFREGHDQVGAMLVLTSPSGQVRHERMSPLAAGTDRWEAQALLDERGVWHWHVTGFDDEIATWRHDAALKIDAGVDTELMFEIGARLLDRAVAEKSRPLATRRRLTALAAGLRDTGASVAERRALVDAPVLDVFTAWPLARLTTDSPEHEILVERRRAGVGSWYEFFPRSEGARRLKDGTWKSGTFRTAAKRLDGVAAMGFDVVYLPPIHPIGVTNRKGPNNTLDPGPDDPGSPWAIGAASGGHDAVHPDLGTLADFRAFVRRAAALGIETPSTSRCRPPPTTRGSPSIPTGSPSSPTAPSATPRTRRRSTRTSTRSTSTTIPRASSTRCCGSCGTGSSRACGSSASTTRTRSP